ncbi:MAG: nicotinate (nicotinamide) nucleotide adenylyltransferase [Hyphomicrobiales bacterium]
MSRLLPPPPIVVPGMRIGLFGGSFDPVHDGHMAVAHEACKRLDLHRVWWLVSPRNPIKSHDPAGSFDERLEVIRSALAYEPRFVATDLERRLASANTAQTLRRMAPLLRRAHFVWIMGADSFSTLDRWVRWQDIPKRLPLVVFDRPRDTLAALRSKAAGRLAPYRIPTRNLAASVTHPPPIWGFSPMRRHPASSTALRRDHI